MCLSQNTDFGYGLQGNLIGEQNLTSFPYQQKSDYWNKLKNGEKRKSMKLTITDLPACARLMEVAMMVNRGLVFVLKSFSGGAVTSVIFQTKKFPHQVAKMINKQELRKDKRIALNAFRGFSHLLFLSVQRRRTRFPCQKLKTRQPNTLFLC